MPMQLRMLSEALDGTLPAGQSGAMMLQMKAAAERGELGLHSEHMSLR